MVTRSLSLNFGAQTAATDVSPGGLFADPRREHEMGERRSRSFCEYSYFPYSHTTQSACEPIGYHGGAKISEDKKYRPIRSPHRIRA